MLFNLFSIVMQEEVNILLILPHRFRCFLYVASSILPTESKSFSQLSVSMHSLRAILNLESISSRLCPYCASETLAKTLEEDFLSWKHMLELPFMLLHSRSTSTANCSENFIKGLSFILPPKSMRSIVCTQHIVLYVIHRRWYVIKAAGSIQPMADDIRLAAITCRCKATDDIPILPDWIKPQA